MKRLILILCLGIGLFSMYSCGGGDGDDPIINPTPSPTPNPDPDPEPAPVPQGTYSEQYRPQIHYTPAKYWVNDPNGMVYINGTWHLFYQYNPYGNDWGNMSWGHATSTDLVHWKELPVALTKDDLGDIFSGSAVIDKNNTAGFGDNAMVVFYTSAGEYQQQSMAYSLDGGMSFKKYDGNPIISNTTRGDFRDPKVFWHEESKQWIMSLALGWEYKIEFWTSKDLRSWTYASTFSINKKECNGGQWECPDLICLDYKGGKKWVLIVNLNPGGPKVGSGIMGFVGDFDGKTFTADELDYPMWMDFGMDNYAGVTWSNDPEGRSILIGWMNNWIYSGDVPCNPWRSAFTLPRQISLVEIDGKPYIASKVAKEIENIAGKWQDLSNGSVGNPAAYHLQITIPTKERGVITLSNEKNEKYELSIDKYNRLVAERSSATGATLHDFSVQTLGRIYSSEENVTLDIYVDQSSVEIFTEDGSMAMTNLVFPTSIYNNVTLPASATKARYQVFESIWK